MTVVKRASMHQPVERLSDEAVELARTLHPFTRAQLAYYGLRRGAISEEDAGRVVEGDAATLDEYGKLQKNCARKKLGVAVFNMFLQAYQPLINVKVPYKASIYSLVDSTVKDDAFIERVKGITREAGLRIDEGKSRLYRRAIERQEAGSRPEEADEPGKLVGGVWASSRTVLGEAVRQNIIPIMAAAELLSEQGVESPLTLTLPEVYFRVLEGLYPRVFERLKRDHAEGKIDVGVSNAHHSIAPLFSEEYWDSREDLKQEYTHSVRYYLENFARPGQKKISLHIPEQALTTKESGHVDLLDILDEVQKECDIKFTAYLCSLPRHHNPGFTLSTATHLKYEGQEVGTNVFFRAFNASQELSFPDSSTQPDPLDPGVRDQGRLEGLTPEKEKAWFKGEAGRILGVVMHDMFGTDPTPNTWRTPLYEGKNAVLSVASDAEWVGHHRRGVPPAAYLAMKVMKEFGIELASTQKALGVAEVKEESEMRPRTASWSEKEGMPPFYQWINPNTQWMIDLVGETLKGYRSPLRRAEELWSQRNPKAGKGKMPKLLSAAREEYGLSLISCPYWWSEEGDYPDSVPTARGLFASLAACGRDLNVLMDRMIAKPGDYNLQPEDVEELERQQAQVRETWRKLLENPKANEYPSIRKTLGKYRKHLSETPAK